MDLTNPQSFNRYVYVLNNPLSFVDLDGRDCYIPSEGGVIEHDTDYAGPMEDPVQKCADLEGYYIDDYGAANVNDTADPVPLEAGATPTVFVPFVGEQPVFDPILLLLNGGITPSGSGYFVSAVPSSIPLEASNPNPSAPQNPCSSIAKDAILKFLSSYAPPLDAGQVGSDVVGAYAGTQKLFNALTTATRKVGAKTYQKLAGKALNFSAGVAVTLNAAYQLGAAQVDAARDGRVCDSFLPMGPSVF